MALKSLQSNTKAKQLISTTKLVKTLLETNPQTRNSDSYLYLKVIEHIGLQKGINTNKLMVSDFFSSMNDYGFPCPETVRRTRQKTQREYPELSACEEVQEFRAENEQAFNGYARSEV